MVEIGRLLTAMVTPFDNDGRVDWVQTKRLAQGLIQSGSDGLVVGATTGEGPTLTMDEKIQLWTETKSAIGTTGSIFANTGNFSTYESIQMTKQAEKSGVDGVLLTVPYYNKPPQEGIYEHFKAVSGSTSLPCILYNIPGRTGIKMSAETTIRLSQIDNIVGVKDATEDFELITKMVSSVRDGFRIWSGNDGDTFPIMCLGGYGVICVISNLVGRQMRRLIDLICANEFEAANLEHIRLLPLAKGMTGIGSNPIPIKYAMNKIGFRVGKPRLPLIEANDGMMQQVDNLLDQYCVDLSV